MMIASKCWWQNHCVVDFVPHVSDFSIVKNWSPTIQIGHQHVKVVTNINRLQQRSGLLYSGYNLSDLVLLPS